MKNSVEKQQNLSINPGDVFALGEHRLACGDARDAALITRLLSGQSIDMLLTDPPYGVGYVESKADIAEVAKPKIIVGDHLQSDSEYQKFTHEWLEAVRPHLAQKNAAYIFNSDRMIFPLREGMLETGFKFAQLIVWVKDHCVVGRLDYLPQHELIAYGWCGTHKFHRGKDKSVLFHPKPNASKLHPTMKPIGLLRQLILNSSKINATVFDPFGGSGSTIIACEQTKRRCFMVETDIEYCQTIMTRFEKLTGIRPVKIS
jgi:DNA modification methylase